MEKNIEKSIKDYIVITIGSLLISGALYFLLAPAQLAVGGVSGLAIIINAAIAEIPVGMVLLVLNTLMFIIGFLTLGKSFGMKTIYSSLVISFFTIILEQIVPNPNIISQDILVVLIFAMILNSIGKAIIFNHGASSGGTDVIAMIITKFIPINIGSALQIADFFVICAAIGVFGIEKGLYALLGILMNGFMIDYIIDGFNVAKYVSIISSEGKKVSRFIMDDLNRSATIYQAQGAYSSSNREVITTVVDRKQFLKLKNEIKRIDPNAFVTVQRLHEVIGKGFEEP